MVECDYLIIGCGFAGIGLKYKLLGKTILIDRNPFQYKIGESQIPDLIHADPGLFSLVPKILKMKSFNRKLGSVFCDSYHGKFATNVPIPLGARFTFHCEREEIERLLVKELSIEINKESIFEIDLSRNVVITDKNEYHFSKYILDCSGPAMMIANKLKLVSPIGKFEGMKAQWGYWSIDQLNKDKDSWADWTVLNKVGRDSWIWQIPIYNSSILSMGMLHRGHPLLDEDFIDCAEKYSAACYRLTSIARHPKMAIKPYMSKVHSRMHYSKRSRQCSGKNWILVGDAYCFADPVYSVGSGVAMLEAVTIASNLNQNKGKFDHAWYQKCCDALLKSVIDGIGTWYSGEAFDKTVSQEINETILRGGFSRHFQASPITERAKMVQQEAIDAFLLSVDMYAKTSKLKIYTFNKEAFVKKGEALLMTIRKKEICIVNPAVRNVFEKHLIGKKMSFFELYLKAEQNMRAIMDRKVFWDIIKLIELAGRKKTHANYMYYFHPEKFESIGDQLKLGGLRRFLIFDHPQTIAFLDKLKAKIVSEPELIRNYNGGPGRASGRQNDIERFINRFHGTAIFGENFILKD